MIYKVPTSIKNQGALGVGVLSPQWWEKWKSDAESVSGTRSTSNVNNFSRLVGPIIPPSTNEIGLQNDIQKNDS